MEKLSRFPASSRSMPPRRVYQDELEPSDGVYSALSAERFSLVKALQLKPRRRSGEGPAREGPDWVGLTQRVCHKKPPSGAEDCIHRGDRRVTEMVRKTLQLRELLPFFPSPKPQPRDHALPIENIPLLLHHHRSGPPEWHRDDRALVCSAGCSTFVPREARAPSVRTNRPR